VDTNLVPATITAVKMDEGNDNANVWSKPGTKSGVIVGSFLVGGSPVIVEADKLGIENVTGLSSGSSNGILHFAFTLKQEIKTGTKLTFRVQKKGRSDESIVSMDFPLELNFLLRDGLTTVATEPVARLVVGFPG